jgi:hypothetical protein
MPAMQMGRFMARLAVLGSRKSVPLIFVILGLH